MIGKLKKGAKLLSVGVGDAHLEKFLQQSFALPKDAITMTDIEFDPETQKIDLPKVQFDLTKKWPKFKNKFDYILFLESFGVAYLAQTKNSFIERSFEDVRAISKQVIAKKNNEKDTKFFTSLAEMDIPQVKTEYETVKQAFNNLKPNGEIRFSGESLSAHELAYILLKLQSDFPGQSDFEVAQFKKIIKMPLLKKSIK